MENQHRKIVGYPELSQEDIDLINEIKAAGRVLLGLQVRVWARATVQQNEIVTAFEALPPGTPEEVAAPHRAQYQNFAVADPLCWATIGKTNIQTGVMALVRAVAQPTDC